MRFASVSQIQRIDRIAIRTFGIPSLILMENAGRAVAGQASLICRRRKGRRICVVCGTGNNGGDGLVAARHLAHLGFETDAVVIGLQKDMKADPLIHARILKNLKIPVRYSVRFSPEIQRSLRRADVIVDALFGVGLNRTIAPSAKDVIGAINASGAAVVSADVPSGLNADTGDIFGSCVEADATVTFTCLKKGMSAVRAKRYTGRVKTVDIGIPPVIVDLVLKRRDAARG